MTTTTWSAAPDNTTDASFRLWGKGISDALAAIGLVQTADSGQINWATVATPPSGSTFQGYEIWRMNDTQQATAPIFFKLEYGSGTTAARPAMRFTWGTSSNGSGTITGTVIKTVLTATHSGNSASSQTGCASAQDGYFWLSFGGDGTSTMAASLGFFRFCDASGSASDEGGVAFMSAGLNNSSITMVTYYATTATVRATNGAASVPILTGLSSNAYGSDVAVYELTNWTDRPARLRGGLAVMSADFAAGSNFTMTSLGSSRTFRPLTSTFGVKYMDYSASVLVALAGEWG